MVLSFNYKNANKEKLNKNTAEINYNVCKDAEKYHSKQNSKEIEKRCCINYVTNPPKVKSQEDHSLLRKTSKLCTFNDSVPSKSSKSISNFPKSTDQKESKRSIINSKCYFKFLRPRKRICTKIHLWQHGQYQRDECGSGIVPLQQSFRNNQKRWCKAPLSTYQATIGDLGRQLLCKETMLSKKIVRPPPCNVDEYILPKCFGYNRKYKCEPPCEVEHTIMKNGIRRARDHVDRYWNPCLTREERITLDVNEFAPHNAYLMKKLHRNHCNVSCW